MRLLADRAMEGSGRMLCTRQSVQARDSGSTMAVPPACTLAFFFSPPRKKGLQRFPEVHMADVWDTSMSFNPNKSKNPGRRQAPFPTPPPLREGESLVSFWKQRKEQGLLIQIHSMFQLVIRKWCQNMVIKQC